MKKLLIASAALAMVAGSAQAQSSVTVYGSFDAGYNSLDYTNIGGATVQSAQQKQAGIAQSGPLTSQRIGFRGTEDLGGGLRANFNLEYGFFSALVDGATTASLNTANGTENSTGVTANQNQGVGGQLVTRTSRVGLESQSLGRLDIGYGLTGLFATVTAHSPLPGNNFIGDVAYTSNSVSSADSRILGSVTGYGGGATRANGLQYTSPTKNGLQAVVDLGAAKQVRNNDNIGDDARVSNAGLTLRYTTGALALAATSHKYKAELAATGSNPQTTTDYQAYSAKYNLTSNFAVNALYAQNKSTLSTTGVQNGKNDVTQVGASYTMGKNVLVAQYGQGNGEGAKDASRRDRKGYQVGAIHNLSKRTNIYGIYGYQEAVYVDNAATTTAAGAAGPSGTVGGGAGTKEKVSGFAVGVRHSF
jgi:predicted porin